MWYLLEMSETSRTSFTSLAIIFKDFMAVIYLVFFLFDTIRALVWLLFHSMIIILILTLPPHLLEPSKLSNSSRKGYVEPLVPSLYFPHSLSSFRGHLRYRHHQIFIFMGFIALLLQLDPH